MSLKLLNNILDRELRYSKYNIKAGMLRQKSKIIQGIDKEISQKINKIIKNSKFKVQFSIRGEELRITGAKRDVLQEVIQTIKSLEIKQPLQFINFRD